MALSAAAGCASQGAVALPARQPQPAPGGPVAAAPASGPRDQVIAAYTGYLQAYANATKARSVTTAAALLRPYAVPAFLQTLLRPLPRVWADHQMGFGYLVPHVLDVRLSGG